MYWPYDLVSLGPGIGVLYHLACDMNVSWG